MVALFFGICIVGILLGIVAYDRIESLSLLGFVVAAIFGFIFIISGILCGTCLSDSYAADRKIAVYEQENARIEEQISAVVEKYLEHEQITYDNLTPEDARAIIIAYPELNSNEIVKKQIEIYDKNSEQLKELKSDAEMKAIWKWWLYFGG